MVSPAHLDQDVCFPVTVLVAPPVISRQGSVQTAVTMTALPEPSGVDLDAKLVSINQCNFSSMKFRECFTFTLLQRI